MSTSAKNIGECLPGAWKSISGQCMSKLTATMFRVSDAVIFTRGAYSEESKS